VPTELVAEFAQATTLAHEAWRRRASRTTLPGSSRTWKKSSACAAATLIYSPLRAYLRPLLDDLSRDGNAEVKAIFAALRPQQVRW